MKARINPAPLSGAVRAITSKSDAHRLLICAALADAPTRVSVRGAGADIDATAACLRALGAGITHDADGLTVQPIDKVPDNPLLDCGESGSTFRFLLPVAAALCDRAEFTGSGRLPERPIADLVDVMEAHGVRFSARKLPFGISGRLGGGVWELPGNVSSQYITGLLLALPNINEDGVIRLTTELESAAYIDITLSALRRFDVEVEASGGEYRIRGGARFASPGELSAEGDWSNAAFFLAAGAIGQAVTVAGLDPDSPQGDKQVLELLRRFGAGVSAEGGAVAVSPAPIFGCEVDLSQTPDLLPILAAVAACAEGETRFYNGSRLRLKESDRLAASANMLRALGGSAEETADGLIVRGSHLSGGTVASCNDHRIAMAAAILATRCDGPVVIEGAEAVDKSYPGFYEDFRLIGGRVNVG